MPRVSQDFQKLQCIEELAKLYEYGKSGHE